MRRLTVPGTRVRPGEVIGVNLQFEAAGALPIEVAQLNVGCYGTIVEPEFLGALRAVHDQDLDGVADAGEPVLARVAAPAVAQDDGSLVLSLSPPLSVSPGAPQQLLLAVDLLLPPINRNRTLGSLPGLTIVHGLRGAADVVARQNGTAVPVTGRWPVEGVLVYQLAEHVLISEIGIGGGDYIELFNPTPDVIDLSDYYITDYTDANGVGYWNLPQGSGFNPPRGDDFLIKFPPGSSLRPGATWVVALWGSGFEQTFGRPPILSAYDQVYDGIGVLGMLASFSFADNSNPPRWRDRPSNGTGGRLRREGEALVLFTWYGGPDLVQDIDIVCWGNAAPPRDGRVEKGGISLDGPDPDTTPGTYLPETPAAQQPGGPVPASFTSRWALRRVDFLESGERQRSGNGISGNDETSEPWNQTFQLDYPDPFNP